MASDLVRFSIAIPAKLLDDFDEYTSQRGLLINRSEAIRNLIRDALVDEELQDPAAEIVGSITLIYDHHTSDLTHKIDEVEHNYPDEIVSSMHVHLDHHSCLEVVAVKGLGYRVNELANCLIGIKGIMYGKLTVAATRTRLAPERELEHNHDHVHPHPHGRRGRGTEGAPTSPQERTSLLNNPINLEIPHWTGSY